MFSGFALISRDRKLNDSENHFELFTAETFNEIPEKTSGEVDEEHSYRKHRSITPGSIKEFNFDKAEGENSDKPSSSSECFASLRSDDGRLDGLIYCRGVRIVSYPF
ncbi:hypothetical protein Dsin_007649 [Dipteronia sinensis]|uniref:Uncharacterized protein n=1 Tax=Dipteronia sinensis TaxID=43782 RepID=A0AAE0B1U0_9ROSI|nr:hypothetical protein Dsin_007649 [Dipteronia sinensis]